MAKASEIAFKLKNLPLGEHRLINIIKLIVDADQFQKEGLFNNCLLYTSPSPRDPL